LNPVNVATVGAVILGTLALVLLMALLLAQRRNRKLLAQLTHQDSGSGGG
jgi:hypothetical protein